MTQPDEPSDEELLDIHRQAHDAVFPAHDAYTASRRALFNAGVARGISIGRGDNDGDYEPGNVRWVTHREQAYNRRTNRWLTADGRTMTIRQWSQSTGLSERSLRDWLKTLSLAEVLAERLPTSPTPPSDQKPA